ncbi:hypothetical protein CYY_000236 [Polysphondylium violaceum]|uniref:Uncharacterized protein n=1 Tax=Polysphondylium violaceum TaxID=133409 RepID=A0A8J4Q292_9MYCE|nr:hypothetical protein CYY_000236 [Polysphondylium violaceum]
MNTFYLIWRNHYIRKLIRNLQCQDLIIHVDDGYLNDNHQYLSLFSSKDKLDYNISINYTDLLGNYISNQYRSLVNDVYFDVDDDTFAGHYDLDHFTDVHKLYLQVHSGITLHGTVPHSLVYLNLDSGDEYESPIVEFILANLPSQLQTLVLSSEYYIARECVVPESLSDLDYCATSESLKWFVVPPNKQLNSCTLEVESIEALEWLEENKWVTKISISEYMGPLALDTNAMIPAHIRSIVMNGDVNIAPSSFPLQLEQLTCFQTIPSHLTHLKCLTLMYYSIKLDKNVLPPSLEYLDMSYDLPLDAGVLPNLTYLSLHGFDQNLETGVLPPSLTTLHLSIFNQPLKPYVLPNNLQELNMGEFNQESFPLHSLPDSLMYLYLDSFQGSFASCQPLDHLKRLKLYAIDPSVSTILPNVKRLDLVLPSMNYPTGTCLVNTRIESLFIKCQYTSSLYANSFPPTLKYLTLSNIDIKSSGVIPNACIYLKSFYTDLNPVFVPQSVNYYFKQAN